MANSVQVVRVAETVATAPQLLPSDLEAVAAAGFRVIINNRPDGEAMGQPTSDEMEAAAQAAGLEYYYYPLNAFNYPGDDLVLMRRLFDDHSRPVLAFCRSGTRSTNLWITTRDPAEQDAAREHAQRLGYDVSMSRR